MPASSYACRCPLGLLSFLSIAVWPRTSQIYQAKLPSNEVGFMLGLFEKLRLKAGWHT